MLRPMLLALTASMLMGCALLTPSLPAPCRCEVSELELLCQAKLPTAKNATRGAVIHAMKQAGEEHRACVAEAHAVASCVRGCEVR